MSEICVCLHAHFYQPPRENPWLEEVERQPSAAPFHDWNCRIAAECYRPNAAARVLDDEGRIVEIRNNYESISFNFGPTLLSWLEKHATDCYAAIVEADHRSRARFGGHGSAMAQPYHHTILPLATPRDRRTQVVWGVADFRHRFGREPEGMWLPETAVDLDTLEALAEHGIRFTVLAPHQAGRTRPLGAADWSAVGSEGIDNRVAYRQRLPSGRDIALFFYDGSTATAVAFEQLLDEGMALGGRLAEAARDGEGPRLAHIATDGESYGHHHAHGEMALAVALRSWEDEAELRLTNYGQFLAEHPPVHEVEILENTSWSCAHGVERWRSDCGCSSGGYPEWTQAWRHSLRVALDDLAADLAEVFEREAGCHLRDPWKARDEYVDVLLQPGSKASAEFLSRHAAEEVTGSDAVRVFRLLEMQRHAMLMFTSCGWFFDDLAGLETRQILAYAARALELGESIGAGSVRKPFLARLEEARANEPEGLNGRQLLEREVDRSRVTPGDLAVAHAAADAAGASPLSIGAWSVEARGASVTTQGRRSAAGEVFVTHLRTGERSGFEYRGLAGDGTVDVRVVPRDADSASEEDGLRVASAGDLRPDVREDVRESLVRMASERSRAPGAEGLARALLACADRPGEPDLADRALELAEGPRVGEPPEGAETVSSSLELALVVQLEKLAASEISRVGDLLATTSALLSVGEAAGVPVALPRAQTMWWRVLQSHLELPPDTVSDIGHRLGFSESAGMRQAGR